MPFFFAQALHRAMSFVGDDPSGFVFLSADPRSRSVVFLYVTI